MAATKIFTDGAGMVMPGSGYGQYSAAQDTHNFGVVDSIGSIWILRYDVNYNLVQAQNIDNQFGTDDHDAPSVLVMDPAGTNPGKILAVYNHHAGVQYSNLTTAANDIRQWSGRVQVTPATTGATFNILYQSADTARTVWLITSLATSAPYTWGYYTTTDGSTWSAYHAVYAPGANTPIVRCCQDPENANIIHWFLNTTLPQGGSSFLYHFYQVAQADGTNKWYKSDGTQITTYGTAGTAAAPNWSDASQFTAVLSPSATNCITYDCRVYGGNPATLYITAAASGSNPTARHTYNLARWTGSAWAQEAIVGADSLATGDGTYAGPDYLYHGEIFYAPGAVLDPGDINTVYLSIAFAGTYAPALPSMETSGAIIDARVQKWTKTAGTWAKAADISGATGNESIKLRTLAGAGSPLFTYTGGTYTSSTSYLTDIWCYPGPALYATKTSAPLWAASRAALGAQGYYLFYEGTGGAGATIHDVTGSYNGTLVNAPTWGTDAYGANIGNFATPSAYVNIDALAAGISASVAAGNRWWIDLLIANTSTTASITPFHLASGTNNLTAVALRLNFGATNTATMVLQSDNGLTSNNLSVPSKTACTDGAYHVWRLQGVGTNSFQFFLDGVLIGSSGTSYATNVITPSIGTIGAFRRPNLAAGTSFFPGTIAAAVAGWGAGMPDSTQQHASFAYKDLITGQFGGTRGQSAAIGYGGLVLGGSAAVPGLFNVAGSGGGVLGGIAPDRLIFAPSASGGAVLGGLAPGLPVFAPSPAGGAVLDGTATASVVFLASASGGAVLAGSALVPGTFTAAAAGGAVLGGSALVPSQFVVAASGGAVVGGTAVVVLSPAGIQTFRQALVAKLLSVSNLTSIVGTAIYPGAIPQTHDLRKDGPALTYSLMKFPLTRHIGRVVTGGSEGILSARVQLSAWSYRYADVDAITDVLFAALEGTLNRTDWGNGTVTIVSATKGEEVDLTLPSGIADYRWIHQIASEYEIRYRVPIPAN